MFIIIALYNVKFNEIKSNMIKRIHEYIKRLIIYLFTSDNEESIKENNLAKQFIKLPIKAKLFMNHILYLTKKKGYKGTWKSCSVGGVGGGGAEHTYIYMYIYIYMYYRGNFPTTPWSLP